MRQSRRPRAAPSSSALACATLPTLIGARCYRRWRMENRTPPSTTTTPPGSVRPTIMHEFAVANGDVYTLITDPRAFNQLAGVASTRGYLRPQP